MFHIKNQNKRKEFSDYPKCNIEFRKAENRNNFLQKTIVANKNKGILISFYSNLPLIRMYTLSGKLIKNIRLQDIHQLRGNEDDFYAEKLKIFYSQPLATASGVYVLYINKNAEEFSRDQTLELQKWGWDGKLLKRYKINEPFSLYTITEDKVFYGLNVQDDNNYLFTGDL